MEELPTTWRSNKVKALERIVKHRIKLVPAGPVSSLPREHQFEFQFVIESLGELC